MFVCMACPSRQAICSIKEVTQLANVGLWTWQLLRASLLVRAGAAAGDPRTHGEPGEEEGVGFSGRADTSSAIEGTGRGCRAPLCRQGN